MPFEGSLLSAITVLSAEMGTPTSVQFRASSEKIFTFGIRRH